MSIAQILFYSFVIAILIPTIVASAILTISLIRSLIDFIKYKYL